MTDLSKVVTFHVFQTKMFNLYYSLSHIVYTGYF